MTISDAVFLERLTAYLAQFSEGTEPIVPLHYNSNGSINREKTLASPCFADFRLEK